MSINYTVEQIKEISDNALLYRQSKISLNEKKKKLRDDHKTEVYNFNKNLEHMFPPKF
jgi:hypothetical protein